MSLTFGSVCSGIGAPELAWLPLGWRSLWSAEIERFPSAVLAYRFPGLPNLGDITATDFVGRAKEYGTIDVLVGGSPCQSFSLAGLRGGMDDPRGGLALRFLEIARDLRPRWAVYENVPGLLSSGGGRDFGSFLGGLAELGYGWAKLEDLGLLGYVDGEPWALAADSPRYRAIGNSMAVPVVRWVGERLAAVDRIMGGSR